MAGASPLPSAQELKEYVLTTAKQHIGHECVHSVPPDRWHQLAGQPLEVILEGLAGGLPEGRDDVAWHVYTQCISPKAKPNANHAALARLLLRGACVLTTNQYP